MAADELHEDGKVAKLMNRWLVVVGAILIQLCLGAIYAWSVFTGALVAENPADVVPLYSPAKLGLEPAKYDTLKKALAPLKDTLGETVKQMDKLADSEDAGDKVLLEALKAKRKSTLMAMDAAVVAAGVKEKTDSLEYGLSKLQTQAIFSAGLASFAIIMVLAGRMMPKVGPQKLAFASAVVLGLGYLLAGVVSPGSFVTTFIFVGLIGGAGIGLGYVVPIAVGMKWFPDKKGLITGLAVAGFGFGATLWVSLAGKLGQLGGGELIRNLGIANTFIIYGIAYLVIVAIGAMWMKFPPEGWLPAGYSPPQARAGAKPPAGSVDFSTRQMLATPQFYMILLCFAFGASAGLMSIGLMRLFPREKLTDAGLTLEQAASVTTMAMGVFFALLNGVGRIAWGTVSDKIGPKLSIVVMMATQGVFVILFQWMAGTPATLYLFAMLIGFNFGGNFALFPTITAGTFGSRHIGQNYGWVFLAYAIGGIFGPSLGGRLGDMGNFPLAFTICGVLCLLAAALAAAVRHPHHVAPAAADGGAKSLETEAEGEADGALNNRR